jgi:predicted aspartyl protease
MLSCTGELTFDLTGAGMQSFIAVFFFTGAAVLAARTAPDPLAEAQKKLRQHDLNGAYETVQSAAAQKPESTDLALALGTLDYLRGEINDSEMDFKRALRLDDKLARAWVGLGRVFEAASLREKAKTCYRNAWKANPNDPEVQRYYARTLTPPEQLKALQNYLAGAAASTASDTANPETADEVRRRAEELKWMGDRTPFALSSPLKHEEIKLSWLMANAKRVRGYSLPVRFNGGKTLHLLMDSGAGGIVLNKKAADAAGLPKITDLKCWGIGDEGDRTGYTASADTVTVGDVSFEHCPVAVSEKRFLTDEDGLIGLDVFSMFLVTVDFQKMVLKLDPLPGHKSAAPDANWQGREVAPEFSSFSPFYRIGHDILLPTSVDNAKPVLFLVDTGATDSLIDPEYARQFTGIRSEDRITMKGVSGKVQKVESAGQLIFEFGHYRQPVPGVLAIPLSRIARDSPRITGLFGVSTLTMFRLQIDYRDGLINLDYVGPKY